MRGVDGDMAIVGPGVGVVVGLLGGVVGVVLVGIVARSGFVVMVVGWVV